MYVPFIALWEISVHDKLMICFLVSPENTDYIYCYIALLVVFVVAKCYYGHIILILIFTSFVGRYALTDESLNLPQHY